MEGALYYIVFEDAEPCLYIASARYRGPLDLQVLLVQESIEAGCRVSSSEGQSSLNHPLLSQNNPTGPVSSSTIDQPTHFDQHHCNCTTAKIDLFNRAFKASTRLIAANCIKLAPSRFVHSHLTSALLQTPNKPTFSLTVHPLWASPCAVVSKGSACLLHLTLQVPARVDFQLLSRLHVSLPHLTLSVSPCTSTLAVAVPSIFIVYTN